MICAVDASVMRLLFSLVARPYSPIGVMCEYEYIAIFAFFPLQQHNTVLNQFFSYIGSRSTHAPHKKRKVHQPPWLGINPIELPDTLIHRQHFQQPRDPHVQLNHRT